MSVQQLLGDAGACPEIEWQGKVWKIGHPTNRARGALEELVAAKAVTSITKLEGVMPPAVYAAMFADVMRDIKLERYKTFDKLWVEQTQGSSGAVLFLQALLRERHPEATEADAISLAMGKDNEVQAAIARVAPGFFDMLVASATNLNPEQKATLAAAIRSSILTAFAEQPKSSTSPPNGSS